MTRSSTPCGKLDVQTKTFSGTSIADIISECKEVVAGLCFRTLFTIITDNRFVFYYLSNLTIFSRRFFYDINKSHLDLRPYIT